MSDGIKIYKNPARAIPKAPKPYVPQYQVMGIEPEEYKSQGSYGYTIAMQKTPQPREQRPFVRQPYAEVPSIKLDSGPIPNVGNNVEQAWSSVDGIVDDLSDVDLNHPMIDNNDFYIENEEPKKTIKFEEVSDSDLLNNINELENEQYLLIIKGVSFCSGSMEYVEQQTNLLIFGNHESFSEPVSVDDILIIKKIKLKIGVFLT